MQMDHPPQHDTTRAEGYDFNRHSGAPSALLNDAYGHPIFQPKDNPFCAPFKMPVDGSPDKTEDQYLLQTDASGLQLKAAVDLSNAVLKDDDGSAKKIMQDAMEKGELKDVLYLTNCFLGAGGSSQRIFSTDSVEKVTYKEDRGTHSLDPKSVQFDNPRATVSVIDLETGKVETVGAVKNDPFHKGYNALEQ